MPTNNVFAVAGAKGGVGKTTTSLNLSAALSAAGLSVVAVELDLQMPNFADFLTVDYDPATDPTLREVLAGTTPVEDSIYETAGGVSVIPCRTDIEATAEPDLTELSAVIETLRWHFDIIFLDTPAGLSAETVRSVAVADETIIVSTPRTAALQNADNTIDLATHHDAAVRGFILNKSGTGASPGVDHIANALEVPLLGHVPEDEAVPHAQDHGRPVVTHSPQSGAAIAYQRLGSDLVDRDGTQSDGAQTDVTPPTEHPSPDGQAPPRDSGGTQNTTGPDPDAGPPESRGTVPVDTAEGDDEETDPSGGHPTEAQGAETTPETTDHGAPAHASGQDQRAASTGPETPSSQTRTDASVVERILSLFGR